MAIMHAWEMWFVDCSCMHRYIQCPQSTQASHTKQAEVLHMHTHVHTKRKQLVINDLKHQKHMRKSALKQCPL